MTITPSSLRRRSGRASRRALTSSGSDEAATSKRRWIALDTLLTFCPPAPCARTAVISTSLSSTTGASTAASGDADRHARRTRAHQLVAQGSGGERDLLDRQHRAA